MGSRQADSLALVQRAERVGWPTERVDAGWKVLLPTGRRYVVHLTYSDGHRALKNCIQEFERAGLTEAETAMAAQRVTERRTKLQLEKEKAEADAKRIQQQNMLERVTAAGPYLNDAEDVDLPWFTTPHPAPWMRWVNITPDIADYLLDHHNADNRDIREATVEHYRRVILSGQWHLTHQGLAIDTRGILQDGQHRLNGVVRAGLDMPDIKVPFAVFVGMPVENFKAIDEGLLRTAAQLFGKAGEKYGAIIQTMIRLATAYADVNPRRQMRLKVTNQTIVDTFEADAEELRASALWASSHAKKTYASNGPVAAARYLLRKHNGPDNAFVNAFFEGLATGRKYGTRLALDESDPRQVFREHLQTARMRGKRLSGIDMMALIILSWNNLVSGNRPRRIVFNDDTDIPRIVICRDKGNNASACPALLYGEVDLDEQD